MNLEDFADSVIDVEAVGTWQATPQPAVGRLIFHVMSTSAHHRHGQPPSTSYQAMFAKLDDDERPQAIAMLAAAPDDEGGFDVAAPTTDHDKSVVPQFWGRELAPCELPESLA